MRLPEHLLRTCSAKPNRPRGGQFCPPQREAAVTPAPLRAELAGLLLQMLGTGARRRRGGVFDVVVRRTARVRGAVGRTTRKQPIAVRKIYGPADRIAEIGCIGVTDFTHNE